MIEVRTTADEFQQTNMGLRGRVGEQGVRMHYIMKEEDV